MNTVTIAGVGLIGGSFALALRQAGFTGRILGVSPAQTIDLSIQLGVIDAGATLEEAAQQSDLIYLAQPIQGIIEALPLLNDWVRPGILVTDAGSTKLAIMQQAAQRLTRCDFIGGHPLAGKESRGVQSADADLFQGRAYVLTPLSPEDAGKPAFRDFVSWLRRIGSVPVNMDAAEHDRVLAHTSHLPQLASTALAGYLSRQGDAMGEVFGPALVDLTRLAMSPFEIWSDIIQTNNSEIDAALAGYIAELEQLRQRLRSPSGAAAVRETFQIGERFARLLRDRAYSVRDFDFL